MKPDHKLLVGIALASIIIVYFGWFFPAPSANSMKVGMVYWPILYNQTSALAQLEQIWNDGFRMWATDVSPDCPPNSVTHGIMQACLNKAESLGMETLLHIPYLNYSDHPVEYQQFLTDFAGQFDAVMVLNEVNRFIDEGSIDAVQSLFWDWVSHLPQNVPVVTSFSAAWLLPNYANASRLIGQIGNRVSAIGLSVYSMDMPEASLPPIFKLLQGFGKPVWVTEIGSSDVQWTIRQLDVLRKNGVSKAFIWEWETFWGNTNFNIRNTEKEQVLSAYLGSYGTR